MTQFHGLIETQEVTSYFIPTDMPWREKGKALNPVNGLKIHGYLQALPKNQIVIHSYLLLILSLITWKILIQTMNILWFKKYVETVVRPVQVSIDAILSNINKIIISISNNM